MFACQFSVGFNTLSGFSFLAAFAMGLSGCGEKSTSVLKQIETSTDEIKSSEKKDFLTTEERIAAGFEEQKLYSIPALFTPDTCVCDCEIFKLYKERESDGVNTPVTQKQLLACAPILRDEIKNMERLHLRVYNCTNKFDYFTFDGFLGDTLVEYSVVRIGKSFIRYFKSPLYIYNPGKPILELGDLYSCFCMDGKEFCFMKLSHNPFDKDQWEKENQTKHHDFKGMQNVKLDTLWRIALK